jgi:transcriptional regulator with GAF, ATPase, and Fis domain
MVAKALHVADARLRPTLEAIVSALARITGFQAGLLLVAPDQVEPQAASGPAAELLDRLQQRLAAGPCVDAARKQVPIRVIDTRDDDRWTRFCASAAALGVRSMVCVPLEAGERYLGTLSLFADRPGAFDHREEQLTTVFATLAAVALADALRTEQLHAALERRNLIGQAQGILMERDRITASAAFDRLARHSQSRNMKLTAVASHLVETGELLDARLPGSARCVQRPAQ